MPRRIPKNSWTEVVENCLKCLHLSLCWLLWRSLWRQKWRNGNIISVWLIQNGMGYEFPIPPHVDGLNLFT